MPVTKSRRTARKEGNGHCQKPGTAVRDEDGKHHPAEREGAVHRQIGKIEYFIGDIYAQRHDGVYKPHLQYRARLIEKTMVLCLYVVRVLVRVGERHAERFQHFGIVIDGVAVLDEQIFDLVRLFAV